MTIIPTRWRYLHQETTRHGKTVYYFRRDDGPRIRIRGEPGSADFQEAYEAAKAGRPLLVPDRKQPAATGTLGWLIERYRASAAYSRLGPSTRRSRDNILHRLDKEHGRVKLRQIDKLSIESGRDKRQDRPEAANSFVKVLRSMYAWAMDAEPDWVKANPAKDVKLLAGNPHGFHTWTIEEVEQFRSFHQPGTKARLAMDLLLFTGFRRSDIVSFGRQHIRNGVMEIRPYKTRETSAITVTLPILPGLAHAIADGPCESLTFIVSERGTPFTRESFTNWFRDRCHEAGVPGSAHGLRKAAATIAAENGATEQHLMAMFGWTTGKMAGLYTKAANRRKLALSGSEFMPGGERDGNTFPRTSVAGAEIIANSSTKSKV